MAFFDLTAVSIPRACSRLILHPRQISLNALRCYWYQLSWRGRKPDLPAIFYEHCQLSDDNWLKTAEELRAKMTLSARHDVCPPRMKESNKYLNLISFLNVFNYIYVVRMSLCRIENDICEAVWIFVPNTFEIHVCTVLVVYVTQKNTHSTPFKIQKAFSLLYSLYVLFKLCSIYMSKCDTHYVLVNTLCTCEHIMWMCMYLQ